MAITSTEPFSSYSASMPEGEVIISVPLFLSSDKLYVALQALGVTNSKEVIPEQMKSTGIENPAAIFNVSVAEVEITRVNGLYLGKVYSLEKEQTKLDEDDYLYLEKYLDATKANLFFARSVIIVEGPGEALLLPTLSKLLGCNFTDYGTSLVDVRSTGLRRYARIFQRKDENKQLDVNVACVTDRDIMPNCAPRICIDEKYTDDKDTWPEKSKRAWRAEADYSVLGAENHVNLSLIHISEPTRH